MNGTVFGHTSLWATTWATQCNRYRSPRSAPSYVYTSFTLIEKGDFWNCHADGVRWSKRRKGYFFSIHGYLGEIESGSKYALTFLHVYYGAGSVLLNSKSQLSQWFTRYD